MLSIVAFAQTSRWPGPLDWSDNACASGLYSQLPSTALSSLWSGRFLRDWRDIDRSLRLPTHKVSPSAERIDCTLHGFTAFPYFVRFILLSDQFPPIPSKATPDLNRSGDTSGISVYHVFNRPDSQEQSFLRVLDQNFINDQYIMQEPKKRVGGHLAQAFLKRRSVEVLIQ